MKDFYEMPYRFHLKPGMAFIRPLIKKVKGSWKVTKNGSRYRDNQDARRWCTVMNGRQE